MLNTWGKFTQLIMSSPELRNDCFARKEKQDGRAYLYEVQLSSVRGYLLLKSRKSLAMRLLGRNGEKEDLVKGEVSPSLGSVKWAYLLFDVHLPTALSNNNKKKNAPLWTHSPFVGLDEVILSPPQWLTMYTYMDFPLGSAMLTHLAGAPSSRSITQP